MSVLILLLGPTAATLAGALLLRRPLREAVPLALRVGLAIMFTGTGLTHFVLLREDLIAMVPPGLPAPGLLVTLTGLLELAGAAGLLIRPLAAWAAGGLALLLVAMFPANVYSATAGLTLGGEPVTGLWPRTGMQVLYLAAAIAVAVQLRRRALRWSAVEESLWPLPTARGPAGPGSSDVVLVSRLQLRSVLQLPGFLTAALALRRALRRSSGAVSLDLAMQPARLTFWTWSVWRDESSMSGYTHSEQHVRVMRQHHPHIVNSTFLTYTAAAAPQDWAEVRRRVSQADSFSAVSGPVTNPSPEPKE